MKYYIEVGRSLQDLTYLGSQGKLLVHRLSEAKIFSSQKDAKHYIDVVSDFGQWLAGFRVYSISEEKIFDCKLKGE